MDEFVIKADAWNSRSTETNFMRKVMNLAKRKTSTKTKQNIKIKNQFIYLK